MGTPHPKYVANRPFTVGRQSFDVGDPVPGGRALALAIKFGQVDLVTKRSKAADPDTPKPTSADQEKTS